MASYPKDRFDQFPDDLKRIGAHRAPRKPGRGWIGFAWAALATGLLVLGGLYGLSRFGVDVGLDFFDAVATPAPPAAPVATADPVLDAATIDPARNIRITVLNGTSTPELQTTVADALAGASWVIDSRGPASERNIEETTVYYSDPLNEDVARGLVVAMGVGDIRLVSVDVFPVTPITIVIGLDHPGATPPA